MSESLRMTNEPQAEITVKFEDERAYDLFANWQPPKAEIVGGPHDGQELRYSATDATPDSPSTPRRLATDDALLAGPNKGQEKGNDLDH